MKEEAKKTTKLEAVKGSTKIKTEKSNPSLRPTSPLDRREERNGKIEEREGKDEL